MTSSWSLILATITMMHGPIYIRIQLLSCHVRTRKLKEYFKHGIYSPFFPLQNAVCFIILTYLVLVLFTFYIQGVLKFKKNNSGAKRLMSETC